MTIYTLPTSPGFVDFQFDYQTGDYSIPLRNGASIEVVSPSNNYGCGVVLPPMNLDQFKPWRAVLSKLTSARHQFYISPPDSGPSTGYAGPEPRISGAGQIGNSIVVDGLSPSSDILSDGDFLSFDGILYQCDSDVSSNGSGVATISLNRALRKSPADNLPVEIFSPVAVMKLDDRSFVAAQGKTGLYSVAFGGIEHITP